MFIPYSYLPSAASLPVTSPGGLTLQGSSLFHAKDSSSSWINPDLRSTLSPGIPERISPNPFSLCFLLHTCSSLSLPWVPEGLGVPWQPPFLSPPHPEGPCSDTRAEVIWGGVGLSRVPLGVAERETVAAKEHQAPLAPKGD